MWDANAWLVILIFYPRFQILLSLCGTLYVFCVCTFHGVCVCVYVAYVFVHVCVCVCVCVHATL